MVLKRMNTQYPKCENEHERLFELYHECSKRVGIQNLVWKTTILLTLKDALITATNRNYCLAKDGFWFLPGGRAEIQETAGETLKFLSETRQPLTKNGQVEWDRRGARTAIPPFSTGTGICYSPKRPSCKTALVKADEIV